MTPGEVILGILGFIGTILAIVAVFRKGSGDSIDRKRETEIERLDGDIEGLRRDLDVVRRDSRIVAGVAVRAIRHIEKVEGIEPFPVTDVEREALERIRPLV